MEIILLERVDKLGAMGDVVKVKPGYARNFLLPQQKALRATKANLARFEAQKEFLEARNAENRDQAAQDGGDIDGKSYVIIRKAGETGQLYGSVNSRDVVDIIGSPVRRNMVVLEQPIKSLGLHDIKIKLHPEVIVVVTINVARSEDEAERQAKGEDVIATQLEAQKSDAEEAAMERAEIAAEMFEGDYVLDEIIDTAETEAGDAPQEPPSNDDAASEESEDTPSE